LLSSLSKVFKISRNWSCGEDMSTDWKDNSTIQNTCFFLLGRMRWTQRCKNLLEIALRILYDINQVKIHLYYSKQKISLFDEQDQNIVIVITLI
jgi:hypothetical protein